MGWLVKLSLVLFLVLGIAQAQAQSLTAEQWAVSLDDGQEKMPLSYYKGQVLWIDFWASWCPPCRASFPWLDQMQKKYASNGFKVIAINVDENIEDAKRFLQKNPVSFSVFYDPRGEAPQRFNVQGMPTSILVDKTGRVHFIHIGFKANQKAILEQKIREVLG